MENLDDGLEISTSEIFIHLAEITKHRESN